MAKKKWHQAKVRSPLAIVLLLLGASVVLLLVVTAMQPSESTDIRSQAASYLTPDDDVFSLEQDLRKLGSDDITRELRQLDSVK